MKHILLIASLLTLSLKGITQSYSQPEPYEGYYDINNSSSPFLQLISEGNLFYQDTSLKNTQGYKLFNRMSQFWSTRAHGDGDINGGTSSVEKASVSLMQSNISCDPNNGKVPNWNYLGPDESPNQNLGIIYSLAIDPQDITNNTLYAGTNASGLWKTTNAMSSQPNWVNITESTNLPGLGVQDIAIDPTNSNTIFIATGVSTYNRTYGIGILRSTDGGITWEIVYGLGASANKTSFKVLIDPDNSNIIYAGAGFDIIRSLDGGNSWDIIYSGLNNIIDLELDLSNSSNSTLYATTRVTNGGLPEASFIKILNCNSINPILDLTITQPSTGKAAYNLSISPSAPQNIYLMDGTVHVSTDGGITWQNAAYPLLGPTTAFGYYSYRSFEISPNDPNILYAGNTQIYRADLNSSNNFVLKASYSSSGSNNVHADIRDILIVDLGTEDGVFLATDGGISYSPNSGVQWNNLNGKGLQITQFYKLGGSEKYPDLLLAGSQDNGTKKIDNGVWSPNYVSGGDGGECLIDGNDPTRYYTISNTSINSPYPNSSPPSTGYTGANMTFHGNDYTAITYSRNDVYENLNQATGPWTKQTFTNSRINALVVAESNVSIKFYAVDSYLNNGASGILWKTVDGGQNWVDITLNFPEIPWRKITDIEINPENENEIWIGVDGFNSRNWPTDDNWEDGIYRVFHSTDGGQTFEGDAYSQGLPYFPVNNIVYQKGGGILYAANDIGVYYKDLNIPNSTWVRYCDNLPICIVSEMEINYCTQKLRIATFGRGLWEADLVQGKSEINANTVWNTNKVLNSNLLIKNGNTLTINNGAIINIAKDVEIEIEQGAQLIIDGATLTNECGQLWNGIEVWGNKFTSQSDLSTHGKLIITNGALIENAREAVRLHQVDNGNNYNSTGGIVQASNSTFKNNKRSIEFLAYENFNANNPSVKLNDVSSITNCQFIYDDTGNMVALGENILAHVSMWKTHGVTIKGNDFINNASYTTYPNSQRGAGIVTIDADYTVDALCTNLSFPCTSFDKSNFEGLTYGIRSMGTSPIARVIIDRSIFNNNRYGVSLEATTFSSVTRNDFKVPFSSSPVEVGGDGIGIHSVGSYGYNFEENTFTKAGKTSPFLFANNYGIVADDSKLNGGLIYKNTYTNMIVDNQSSNDNTVLIVDCNTHNGGTLSRYNMAVSSGDLNNQGSCGAFGLPAKNSFPTSCTGDKNIHHYSSSPSSLIYSAKTADLPNCVTTPEVNNNGCGASTVDNDCPSSFTNPNPPSSLLAIRESNKTEIVNLYKQFDGGDKDGLIDVIANSSNGQVKNKLLTASPYLSDEVLISFLEKPNPLPAGHIQQIITANSPVTAKVMSVINDITLPNGIRNQINTSQTGVSARALLENDIHQLKVENQLLKNEYIRFCYDHHVYQDVENILKEEYNSADKSTLIQLAFTTKEQAKIPTLINDLRSDAASLRQENEESEKANEIDKICFFYENTSNIDTDGGVLSEEREAMLREIALEKNAIAINAQNALFLYKGESVSRKAEPIVESISGARIANTSTFSTNGYNYQLNNYPNPFNENTIIETELPNNVVGELIISDVTGKLLKQIKLTEGVNKSEINGNELGYGTYFYSLYINNELIQTKKMTRIR